MATWRIPRRLWKNSKEIVADAQNWAKLQEVENFQSGARDAIDFEDLVR